MLSEVNDEYSSVDGHLDMSDTKSDLGKAGKSEEIALCYSYVRTHVHGRLQLYD